MKDTRYIIIILTQKSILPCACFYSQNKISALPSHVFKLKFSCNFCFQGQFGYGGADDLWNVNGGVPFTAASSTGTTHNNNAYYVQVSNSFSINTYICVCLFCSLPQNGTKTFLQLYENNLVVAYASASANREGYSFILL